jgi:hypothetical protein
MKCLFACHDPPAPANNGGSIDMLAMLEGLARLGAEITYAEDYVEEWRKHVGIYYNTLASRMDRVDSLRAEAENLPGRFYFDVKFSPDQTRFLYARDGIEANKSRIDDILEPDFAAFPLFDRPGEPVGGVAIFWEREEA